MTTPDEDLRRLADALAERVVVPPFAVVEARRRRRRARWVAVPVLAAAAVALGAVAVHALRPGSSATSTAASSAPTAAPVGSRSAVAAEPVRPCTAADLRADFTPGGHSTGRQFGTVDVRNVSSTPCSPGTTVTMSALYGPRLVVSRSTVPQIALEGDRSLRILLAGPERDDPQRPGTLCRAADRVAPTQLGLAFAHATVEVRDAALRDLATCHGDLAVLGVDT